ncbi:unnamed protein product [Prunus brigantina]
MESFQSKVAEEYEPFEPFKLQASNLIQQELEEMQSNPSDDFKCLALESNRRDWQFAIRGLNGTEFAGGIYHGQIKIPEEYPKEPPIITLLTENGRFKTQPPSIWLHSRILGAPSRCHRRRKSRPYHGTCTTTSSFAFTLDVHSGV